MIKQEIKGKQRLKQRLNREPPQLPQHQVVKKLNLVKSLLKNACSFIFPEEIPRPYQSEIGEKPTLEDYETEDFIDHNEAELDQSDAEKKKMKERIKVYERAKAQALKELDKWDKNIFRQMLMNNYKIFTKIQYDYKYS